MEKKRNVVEKAITHHNGGNKIDVISKTDKPQASQSKKDKSIRNEAKIYMSLDKSRSLDNQGIIKELKQKTQ